MLSKFPKDQPDMSDQVPTLRQIFSMDFPDTTSLSEEDIERVARDWLVNSDIFEDCEVAEYLNFIEDLDLLYLEHIGDKNDLSNSSKHIFLARTLGAILGICLENMFDNLDKFSSSELCYIALIASRYDVFERNEGPLYFSEISWKLVERGVENLSDHDLSIFFRSLPKTQLTKDLVEENELPKLFDELENRLPNLSALRQIFCLSGLANFKTSDESLAKKCNELIEKLIDILNKTLGVKDKTPDSPESAPTSDADVAPKRTRSQYVPKRYYKFLHDLPTQYLAKLEPTIRRAMGDFTLYTPTVVRVVESNLSKVKKVVKELEGADKQADDDKESKFMQSALNFVKVLLTFNNAFAKGNDRDKRAIKELLLKSFIPLIANRADVIANNWDLETISGLFCCLKVVGISIHVKSPHFSKFKIIFERMRKLIVDAPYFSSIQIFHHLNNTPRDLIDDEFEQLIERKLTKVFEYRTRDLDHALEYFCELVNSRNALRSPNGSSVVLKKIDDSLKEVIHKIGIQYHQAESVSITEDFKHTLQKAVINLPNNLRDAINLHLRLDLGFRITFDAIGCPLNMLNKKYRSLSTTCLEFDSTDFLQLFYTPELATTLLGHIAQSDALFPPEKRKFLLDFPSVEEMVKGKKSIILIKHTERPFDSPEPNLTVLTV